MQTVAAPRRAGALRGLRVLGPAFVAAVAYVDPGNVAANTTAGAQYGYLLVWVLVAANAMAALVQYSSARLGILSGRSLPALLGDRLSRPARLAFWAQAEVVAAATDVAEVIGGAIALNLLFGLPLALGGLIVGIASLGLLAVQSRGQRRFEAAVVALLAVLAVGFSAGVFVGGVDWGAAAGGLLPRFDGPGSVVLAAAMLGATVMPHVVDLHSALVRDPGGATGARLRRLLRGNAVDVVLALLLAGAVNVALLLLAAAHLRGAGEASIPAAAAAITQALGTGIGVLFAIGLLASGLASSSVGAYAGAVVMSGLLHVRVPMLARRAVVLVPALVLLASGVDATAALVVTQAVLCVGIPFALIPLVRLNSDATVVGEHRIGPLYRAAAWTVTGAIVVLDGALLVFTVLGLA